MIRFGSTFGLKIPYSLWVFLNKYQYDWKPNQNVCAYQTMEGHQQMMKRITVSLDDKLIWLLRNKQAEMMLKLNKPISISGVANGLLDKIIKDENKINSELDLVFVHPNGMHFQVDKI